MYLIIFFEMYSLLDLDPMLWVMSLLIQVNLGGGVLRRQS